MRLIVLSALTFLACAGLSRAQETASTRAADGFQCPVGPDGTGEGYYVARGYRPNGHLGEDWNGTKGGDTDLGDPVYAVAHGYVVFAKNYHLGWGNVVIIRHAYYEGFSLKFVDSLYGHLLNFKVREGDQVKRGQLIGHIGSNNGMYDAHLHFEMRKNLQIGMYRSSFPRDFSNYYAPSQFIAAHRVCDRGNRTVMVPVNTFPANAPPSYVAGRVYTPVYAPGNAPDNPAITSTPVLPPARITSDPGPSLRLTVEPPKPAPTLTLEPKPTPTPTPKESVTTKPSPTPKTKVVASATPTPKKEVAKETRSTPAKSTTKAEATPAAKTTASAKPTPRPTAAVKPTPTPSKKSTAAATTPKSEPTPRPSAAKVLPPVALDTDSHEPPLPTGSLIPTQGSESPIRRGGSSFQVDRYPDMRGKNY